MAVPLTNSEDTTNVPTNCENYGEVSVYEGTNGFGQDVYRCRGISSLFGGGLYDTWLGQYLEDLDSQDIDRIFRQQEADAFKELLDGLENGTKTWRDLQEFELDFLAEIPEMVEYKRSLEERLVYDNFLDEFGNAVSSGDSQAVSDLLSEYESAGVKNNSYFTSTGPTMPPGPSGLPNLTGDFQTQMIKALCQGTPVCAGVDICFEPGQTDCIDPSSINDLWEDVVSHVYIVFGDLGLPIPDWLPLPGVLKLPTLGNIWEKIQTTIGNIANSEDNCLAEVPAGENPDEYCSYSNRITRAIQEGSQDVVTKAGEILDGIFGTIVEGVNDPAEAARKIWDWIKGGYGDDPSKAPPWIWEIIVASEIYGQKDVQDALEDIIGTDINDDGSIGTTEPIPYGPNNPNPDCTAKGLETAEDGTCVPAWQNDGPSPQDCANENRSHVPADPATQTPSSCGECLTGFEEVGDQCQEEEDPITNNGPTAAECAAENRGFNPATDVEDSSCGECLSGFKEEGDSCVEDTGTQECANGATNYPDCNECPTGYKYDAGTRSCVEDNGTTTPDDELCNGPRPPQTQNDKTYCLEQGYSPCPEGTEEYLNGRWYKEGDCTPVASGGCPDGSAPQYDANDLGQTGVAYFSGRHWSYDPCNPDAGYTEVFQCNDGSFEENVADCPVQGCDDPNRQVDPETGGCGDKCKDGTAAPENGLCPEPITCEDENATNYNGAGECVYEDCANGAIDPENSCVTCPAGMKMGTGEDGMEVCVDDGLTETCDNGKTVESGCQDCPEGTVDDGEGGCQQVFVCDDPNATVVSGGPTSGACGPCKPGYTYDGSPEKCVKDGCPEGQMMDQEGNCIYIPIDCPEGQQFCESSGTCEEPQNCPGGPNEGGGGGGGGGGLFDIEVGDLGISGDPKLLGRQRFGAQDFVTPLFTGNQGGGTDFPIARFLQGKGDIV